MEPSQVTVVLITNKFICTSCPQRDAREEVQMWGGGGQRSSLWGRWVQWQLEGEENHIFLVASILDTLFL